MIRRAYVTLANGQQIHYRHQGQGYPVILLHPSPLSSAFMTPLITAWSANCHCLAWDTPGYGQSDPLPGEDLSLSPYVESLAGFIRTLELEPPVIYGSATGAQIAIEFGKTYPGLTRSLLLENVASFTDKECESMLPHYFPSLDPQPDGEHLHTAWDIASRLYQHFPWYEADSGQRDLPLSLIQQTALDYLRAGPRYDRAYRAAFANERIEALQPLAVETHIINWSGSIIREYSDRLCHANLPPNLHLHQVEGDLPSRYHYLKTQLIALLQGA